MAHVMPPHPHLDFHAGPVKQSPSPFGFGFGLSSPSTVMGLNRPNHLHGQLSAFQPAPVVVQPSPVRGSKRRHEPEEEENRQPRDESMDRSPTPERPKRVVPKRARMAQSGEGVGKGDRPVKDSKGTTTDGNDMDVGVLLASLPPESLLPLITSLLNAQPSLKPAVLSLIPRPTLDTALHALAQAAKKLHDAYPFSNASHPSSSTSFSGGFGHSRHHSSHSNLGFGFSNPSAHFSNAAPSDSMSPGGMRDSYVLSRLRPHIDDFLSTASTYLPYFSCMASGPHGTSQAQAIPSQSKEKLHPTETFTFLSALTTHILDQPPLTQSSLVPLLLPRLTEEWRAWTGRVDESVNRQGRMYREETVRTWERDLDAFACAKDHGLEAFRDVRDRWVEKVGWLVGRMGQPMEES